MDCLSKLVKAHSNQVMQSMDGYTPKGITWFTEMHLTLSIPKALRSILVNNSKENARKARRKKRIFERSFSHCAFNFKLHFGYEEPGAGVRSMFGAN